MSDVNFLFVSPVSPKIILAYGLFRQVGSSLLMVVVMLCYTGTLIDSFAIRWGDVLLLGIGVAVLLFFSQVLSLVIYSYSNGNPKRIRMIRSGIYGYVAAVALLFGRAFINAGSGFSAVLAASAASELEGIPVVGWLKGMAFSAMEGAHGAACLYGGLAAAAVVALVVAFMKSDTDYYEDVLENTEIQYQARQAVREGRTAQNKPDTRKIKVKDTGIGRGWGASAFFYKHLREMKRRSRFIFVNTTTVTLLGVNLALQFFLNWDSSGERSMTAGLSMAICLAASVYVLFFMNFSGEWMKELTKPYLFLAPEKPFAKLMWASLTTVLKPVVDGAIVFSILCAVLKANPLTALGCVLVYGSFGFLFTASNVLSERVLGQMANKGLIMLLYMLLLLLLIVPGAVCSAVLFSLGRFSGFVVCLPMTVWNVLVSLGIFAAYRNILSTAEIN